jgi:hypothetical protein
MGEFSSQRQQFWSEVPTGQARRAHVIAALQTARNNYLIKASLDPLDPNMYPTQLLFKTDTGKEVCEKFYANLLGMSTAEGYKNKPWVDEVNAFVDTNYEKKVNVAKTAETTKTKLEHAYAYILQVVDSQVMDKSAHANYDSHSYLPYQTVGALFDEYVYISRQLNTSDFAHRTTFDTAYKQLVKAKKRDGVHIRLSGGKGNAPVSIYLSLCVMMFFEVG